MFKKAAALLSALCLCAAMLCSVPAYARTPKNPPPVTVQPFDNPYPLEIT